jgi:hypothetical protein
VKRVDFERAVERHEEWLRCNDQGERMRLSEETLEGIYLEGKDLRAIEIDDSDMGTMRLENADLRDASFHATNLHSAYLSGADLRGANLDYSCLPLSCGGLGWKIDARLARQLAYHLCSMICDDPEFLEVRSALLLFANKFHRAQELGLLEE